MKVVTLFFLLSLTLYGVVPCPIRLTFLQEMAVDRNANDVRLRYARWLRSNGDKQRARFIELQISRSMLKAEHPKYLDLLVEERELLRVNGAIWSKEDLGGDLTLPKGFSLPPETERFNRGFVAQVEIDFWEFYQAHRSDSPTIQGLLEKMMSHLRFSTLKHVFVKRISEAEFKLIDYIFRDLGIEVTMVSDIK